jgi:hypothetical protein
MGYEQPAVQAAEDAARQQRCVVVEVFVDQTRELDQQLEADLKRFAAERDGLLLAFRKLQAGESGGKRLADIAAHFKITPQPRPLIYCMNRVIHDLPSAVDYQRTLEQALQLEVFVRDGCSRCTIVKRFLPTYVADYPALRLLYRDIGRDNKSLQRLDQLVAKHQRAAASVPVIHICDQLLIGLSSEQVGRHQLDAALERWTKACPPPATSSQPDAESQPDAGSQSFNGMSSNKQSANELAAQQSERNHHQPAGWRHIAVLGGTARHPFSLGLCRPAA